MYSSEFCSLSANLGKDYLLVQGAGGNTSYKKDGVMWIKASGCWLAHAERKNIFVPVDYKKICHKINKEAMDPVKGQVIGESSLRPSIETTLHALMPHKIVLHTHPVESLSWLIMKNGKVYLNETLKNIRWSWVPYSRPGIELTHAVKKEVYEKQVDALLLGNHGLVVGGKDCQSAFDIMKRIIDRCRTIPRVSSLKFDQKIEQLAEYFNMRLPQYEEIHSLALDNIAYKYCNDKSGILYPDQAVFLGSVMPCYDGKMNKEGIASFLKKLDSPSFLIIKGKGVLISKNAKKDIDEMLRCHSEVLMRIGDNEKLNYLTENEVARLLDWEPEKYRQKLSK
jgi:rhamnose utilization protein RhaD (predicted bifunctional aldolase and dehydrogenase)